MGVLKDVIIRAINGGVQTIVFFENGYGASVVQHDFSYGRDEGLFEIAVVTGDRNGWLICYDTEITDDVLGWQSEQDVEEVLRKIGDLSQRTVEAEETED
jgi:hypothetical protein